MTSHFFGFTINLYITIKGIPRLVLYSRVAARRAGQKLSTISTKFYVWYFYSFFLLRELRLRDRISAAKYRVCTAMTACTSLTGDQGDEIKNNVSISESV